jgi:hypothetical protein
VLAQSFGFVQQIEDRARRRIEDRALGTGFDLSGTSAAGVSGQQPGCCLWMLFIAEQQSLGFG